MIALVIVWALGNGAIVGLSYVLSKQHPLTPTPVEVSGVGNLEQVDAHLWRSAAPSEQGYRDLAAAGVRTVIDLRDARDPGLLRNPGAAAVLPSLGVRFVRIPVEDGQAPDPGQVEEFLSVVRDADGVVLVHCGAGVGRTGSMVAAYEVSAGAATGFEAMTHGLAVGPPSFEQIMFMVNLEQGDIDGPGFVTTAISRALDGPRILWNHVK